MKIPTRNAFAVKNRKYGFSNIFAGFFFYSFFSRIFTRNRRFIRVNIIELQLTVARRSCGPAGDDRNTGFAKVVYTIHSRCISDVDTPDNAGDAGRAREFRERFAGNGYSGPAATRTGCGELEKLFCNRQFGTYFPQEDTPQILYVEYCYYFDWTGSPLDSGFSVTKAKKKTINNRLLKYTSYFLRVF